MTPVTIVPPGRASSKACNCEGASGLRSSPGGAQAPEEQEERPKEVPDPAGTQEEEEDRPQEEVWVGHRAQGDSI